MTNKSIIIREAIEADVPGIISAHRNSIREKASHHYDQNIIDQWAPDEVPLKQVEKLKQQVNGNEWFTLIAEADGTIIGFGQVNPGKNILGAVYVQKNPYGLVGKKLLAGLIGHAKEKHTGFLEMSASVNSEAFYQEAGFKTVSHDIHVMQSGTEMACVKMRLDL